MLYVYVWYLCLSDLPLPLPLPLPPGRVVVFMSSCAAGFALRLHPLFQSLILTRPRVARSVPRPGHSRLFTMSPNTPRQDEAGLPPALQRETYLKPVERVTDQLEIPSLDDRQYRVIRLPNDLEALLVHDPETDKASAALDVNVGNFSDEDTMPGMAHAVEHVRGIPCLTLALRRS